MAKRKCKGKNVAGKPCGANPLKDSVFCLAHSDEETRDNAGFGGPQEGAGRPRRPRIIEELAKRIEADIDKWLEPLETALATGKPVVVWDAHEGRHEIKYVADPELGMKALRLALDRAYGRPRQEVELTGSDGGPVDVELLLSDKTLEKLDDVVDAIAAARED